MKHISTILSIILVSYSALASSKIETLAQEVYEIASRSGAYAINAKPAYTKPDTNYAFNKSIEIDFIAEKNYYGHTYGSSNQLIVTESAVINYELTDDEAVKQIGDLMNKNSEIKLLSIRRDGFMSCQGCPLERKYIVSITKTNKSGVSQKTILSLPRLK